MSYTSDIVNGVASSGTTDDVVMVLQKALWLKNILSLSATKKNKLRIQSEAFNYEFVKTQKPQYWPAGIAIDTRLQETYSYHADVTRHAVESGVIFSDHVILQPVRVELSFEVTNFDGLDRPKKALTDFIKLWMNRKVFDLITEHRILENMLCTSIQADNSLPAWGKLAFRASFQQIKFVSLQTVRFPSNKVQGGGAVTGGPANGNSSQSATSSGTQNPTTSPKSSGKKGLFKGSGGSFAGNGATGGW